MHFYANEAPDEASGDAAVWQVLRDALAGSEGVVWYRYPVFSGRGSERHEPTIVAALKSLGVLVIDVVGTDASKLLRVDGDAWEIMDDPRRHFRPVIELDDHLHEVRALVEREHELRRRLMFTASLALPHISREEWSARAQRPAPSNMLFKDDLSARALRVHLVRTVTTSSVPMDDATYEILLGALRGRVRDRDPAAQVASGLAGQVVGPLDVIRAVDGHARFLDEQQDRVACEIPDGPQRIRGLAGTGKTVLLCRRAAFMHARHPDWDIALVFYSRGLYQAVTRLVREHYRRLTGEDPDPKRLRILHGWGSHEQAGFYRELCSRWGKRPLSFKDTQHRVAVPGAEFTVACEDLESRVDTTCQPLFDAVLMDEGQDLPPSFYRLAHRALRAPKRLVWAYDEAQGIGSLVVPSSAEVFGRAADGTPLVDIGALGPRYPSGIAKAHNLNRCYRTPAHTLVTAHAVNMGLLRAGGPLQGVSNAREWAALGYAVVEGSFSKSAVAEKARVVIARDRRCSGHPVDQLGLDVGAEPQQVLEIIPWSREWDQTRSLARSVKADLEAGMRPEDILVVPVNLGRTMTSACFELKGALTDARIPSIIVGEGDAGPDEFKRLGHVTIAQMFRAKGNEAWKVYACNLHLAGSDHSGNPDEELRLRNAALVALTRSRLYTVALGKTGEFMRELAAAAKTAPRLEFTAFNAESLRRSQDVGTSDE